MQPEWKATTLLVYEGNFHVVCKHAAFVCEHLQRPHLFLTQAWLLFLAAGIAGIDICTLTTSTMVSQPLAGKDHLNRDTVSSWAAADQFIS